MCRVSRWHIVAGYLQYVNDLIIKLRDCNAGCYISSVFIGCIVYADDIILLSPTVAGMQCMLDVCTEYGHVLDIVCNAKKCMCNCACVSVNRFTSW